MRLPKVPSWWTYERGVMVMHVFFFLVSVLLVAQIPSGEEVEVRLLTLMVISWASIIANQKFALIDYEATVNILNPKAPTRLGQDGEYVDGEPATIIQTDGRTVWVHAKSGHTVGRFGVNGIDVHTADSTGCLDCTHEPTGLKDWRRFQQSMYEHHAVMVADDFMPERLRDE